MKRKTKKTCLLDMLNTIGRIHCRCSNNSIISLLGMLNTIDGIEKNNNCRNRTWFKFIFKKRVSEILG